MLRPLLVISLLGPISVHAQNDGPQRFLQEILAKDEILPTELKDSLIVKDFSAIWTTAPNWAVHGSIGDSHQRLRMKLLSVIKDPTDQTKYRVYGKSKVKDNICEFQGEFTVTNIRQYDDISYGLDETYRDSSIQGRFLLCGMYRLLEDPRQRQAGILSGTFASYFYIDRNGAIRYDNIEDIADGYCNNQFVGTWVSYSSNAPKRCNWGDQRIPMCGDLDVGAGDFSPDEKYALNGWRSYIDAYGGSIPDKRALEIERAEWWK